MFTRANIDDDANQQDELRASKVKYDAVIFQSIPKYILRLKYVEMRYSDPRLSN